VATATLTNWRTTRKGLTFRRIQEEAMRLFLANGYEATTVEEVAAAAGVSHMTVFRHFPTKEALVLTDEYDALFVEALRQRPATESPLDSLERAMIDVMGRISEADADLFLRRSRLIGETPALQAGMWAFWMEAQRVVADALADRGGVPSDPLSLRVAAGIAFATAMTASLIWVEGECRGPITDVIAEAFAAARREFAAAARSDDPNSLVRS
jgi:AcrR family transcriptional regulator